jgi:hypothetical protein
MAISTIRISDMILSQLARGERRLLSLVVAIRGGLNESGAVKGDLSATVKSALRKLIASGAVLDVDGVYSLSRPK